MMRYPPQILEQIKARLNLVEEVRRSVPTLKKRGKYWWANCPFHNEKSASFHVRDEGNYYCFGCGAHGDVVTWTMETQGVDFMGAIKQLADKAGVVLPTLAAADKVDIGAREAGFGALERAAVYFRRCLGGSVAEGYLAQRGVGPAAVAEFGLGFAPAGWRNLADALATEGIGPEVLRETGLTTVSEKGKGDYDRFRNRLMFPIHDLRGRVVAFGGRVMDKEDTGPKYLNSPETPFFSKGHLLFNLHRAKPEIRRTGQALLVEGYMDVVALWQAGLKTAVAPMGTAVGEDQLALLWQQTPMITVCLDGDAAGRRAALRAAERALGVLEPGKSLQFVWLPDGEDPDSLIKKDGLAGMTQLLARPTPLEDVLWEHVTGGVPPVSADGRAETEANMAAMLAQIKHAVVKKAYGQALRDRLWAATRGGQAKRKVGAPPALLQAPATYKPAVQGDALTRTLVALVLRWPDLLGMGLETLGQLRPPPGELADCLTALLRSAAQGVAPVDAVAAVREGLFAEVVPDLLRASGVAALPDDADFVQIFMDTAHAWAAREARGATRARLLERVARGEMSAEEWAAFQQAMRE